MSVSTTASPCFALLRRSSKNGTLKLRRTSVTASETSEGGRSPFRRNSDSPPDVDTRIHWDNPDEGWLGGNTIKADTAADDFKNESFRSRYEDLIRASTTSHHYRFLDLPPDADIEEIKAAFKRLSRECHPDTTSLPLKTASAKFKQLEEAYDVLSNEESRKSYDCALAKEAEDLWAERMRIQLEDPYQQDLVNWKSVPNMVDRLEGRNMELSEVAATALSFDAVAILFSICCIIYVLLSRSHTAN